MKIREIETWHTFATALPERTVGGARIKRVRYEPGVYRMYGVDGFDYYHTDRFLPITTLELRENDRWKTWMVDDPPHWEAMRAYARNSQGDVLVGGLGLGMLASELLENPKVGHVVVVERDADVIDLIGPYLVLDKLTIVQADFWEYVARERRSFASVLVDLWVTSGYEDGLRQLEEDVIPHARELIRKWPLSRFVFHGFGNAWLRAYDVLNEEA